jgi:hypothetical protein
MAEARAANAVEAFAAFQPLADHPHFREAVPRRGRRWQAERLSLQWLMALGNNCKHPPLTV